VLRLPAEVATRPATAIASVVLLCGIAALHVQLDAISALGGATGGALLIYVAPAMMTLQMRGKMRGGGDGPGRRDGSSADSGPRVNPNPTPGDGPGRRDGSSGDRAPPLSVAEAASLYGLAVVGLVCGAVGTMEALS